MRQIIAPSPASCCSFIGHRFLIALFMVISLIRCRAATSDGVADEEIVHPGRMAHHAWHVPKAEGAKVHLMLFDSYIRCYTWQRDADSALLVSPWISRLTRSPV